ncbi:uridine kinase family protein [Saccharothrix australiensis]|uniref:Cytidylate kinase-like protein n=1 Tax=Saccharothrix australiensis TaxID=2072 RepID=A0A495VRX4_9PSEU|nr:(d)CMP kinase [Saccharothrix australiensis]RKT52062.1 cytidylate kinase-like protein [Saccharothrix australiensis]
MRLIAVDGPSGSGKSTYAASLAAELGATVVPTDHFATWTDPVSWWPRLVSGVLVPLWAGRPGRYRRVDWSEGWPREGDWVTVEVPEVLVIEGVSAARRSIADRLDEAVWVELPDERERLERAVARDGEASRAHLVRWQAFERGWFAVDGTRDRADRIVTVS